MQFESNGRNYIEPLTLKNQLVSLRPVDEYARVLHTCCSKLIEPINAVARGELANRESYKRNAVITLINFESKETCRNLEILALTWPCFTNNQINLPVSILETSSKEHIFSLGWFKYQNKTFVCSCLNSLDLFEIKKNRFLGDQPQNYCQYLCQVFNRCASILSDIELATQTLLFSRCFEKIWLGLFYCWKYCFVLISGSRFGGFARHLIIRRQAHQIGQFERTPPFPLCGHQKLHFRLRSVATIFATKANLSRLWK